jgi:hypothetical protein
MKADVHPRTPGHFDPLVHDPRMRNVWGPLSRRRADGTYMHPALPSVPGADADERQANAMADLLNTATHAVLLPGTIITRREAEQKRSRFLAKAEELRVDAEMWLRDAPATAPNGIWRDHVPDECWRRLMDASRAYKEIAAETYVADVRYAGDRDRADGDVRWFALIIANRCRALFGSPLYGITATIASIALGQKIEQHTVRKWCAPPCK